jgi:hypothetical protein
VWYCSHTDRTDQGARPIDKNWGGLSARIWAKKATLLHESRKATLLIRVDTLQKPPTLEALDAELKKALPGSAGMFTMMVETGGEREMDTSRLRVVLVCMDKYISSSETAVPQFRAAVAARKVIIPIIWPGYEIKNYNEWWPSETCRR